MIKVHLHKNMCASFVFSLLLYLLRGLLFGLWHIVLSKISGFCPNTFVDFCLNWITDYYNMQLKSNAYTLSNSDCSTTRNDLLLIFIDNQLYYLLKL